MTEETIVRENLMTEKGYRPYCGNDKPRNAPGGCSMPRVNWSEELHQFVCPECGWVSKFPQDFISRYMTKWNLK